MRLRVRFLQKSITSVALRFALTAVIIHMCPGSGHTSNSKDLSRQQQKLCPSVLTNNTIKFSGLYPAIEHLLPLSNFELGQIVEIDPRTMSDSEAREFIGSL